MESVLPSEIARLVYGYLEAEGCTEAAHSFLEKSPHLQECLKVAQEGRRFSTRIHGRTLVQTLDLFFNINSIIQERAEKLNNTTVNNTSLTLNANNSLVEQLFNLLEGTNTSGSNRVNAANGNTVLLSITVPSQDDNSIRVRQHSNGKRRMSIDADPSKSKGKIPQHTSNVETHKLRKDRNTEDEPVIDLSCGEELLTRLLDNTQLHEKIAENINKAICTPEKKPPDGSKDVIQTILKQTEADPLFEQLITELVGPAAAEDDSTTPEDTEFEDGHLRNGSVDRENEDDDINIKQRLRSSKPKDKSTRDVLEEQNASAVQSILDSCHTRHKNQPDSDSDQVNRDRSESDKENERNCSNLLQAAMLNCDINSPPQETGGKSKVDGQFSSEDDHQQPMDMCFIDVGQLSPQPSQQVLEPSSQEKASNMLLIQSDNLATTSTASGSQIIIPPTLCPNMVTVQPGYTNVLTVLTPAGTTAPTVATSTPTVQNKNIPVLLYEDFLRLQSTHSPIGISTMLQTPTSLKQYKPIAPKPVKTSETTTVPAYSSSGTINSPLPVTSGLAKDKKELESVNTTVVPIVCAAVNNTERPSTSTRGRRGKGWRRGMKGSLRKKLRSPELRKILPKRPPVRTLLNVREQKLINGVEVKVLDFDTTQEEEDEAVPAADKEESDESEGPKIEVISVQKIQANDVTDHAENEINVDTVEARNDTDTNKCSANIEGRTTSDNNKSSANTEDRAACDNKSRKDTPELRQSKKGLSLSTPRRKHSHVRALDFNTPPRGVLKRPNTSPKAANKWSPRKSFLRNAKRSALFRSPVSNKSKKKLDAGDSKQQNLSTVSETEEELSVCIKGEIHLPVNGTPRKEDTPSKVPVLPPVATRSPATKLCGDWGQVNGVELILSSPGKEAARKSWDADLRAIVGGQFQDPSPPPKKRSAQKRESENIINKSASPKNNTSKKFSNGNSMGSKVEPGNKKRIGKKKETRVTAKQTKNQNKGTKRVRAEGRQPTKRNTVNKSKEKPAQEKTYLSKEFISDTESSDLNESKKEQPSKTNEQNSDNENANSVSSENSVLMIDDGSQENHNKSSLSESDIARQLEENIRQIVGDELSSDSTDKNSVISTDDVRKVLESSKDFVENEKNTEENKRVSNEDNCKSSSEVNNDTAEHNNITPSNIVSSERPSSKSLLQQSTGTLPVLETPVKLDFVGVVPKTPNLDTPMLKVIRENTSILSADLLLTPFAQTPLQTSLQNNETPYKDVSPNSNSVLEQVLIRECHRMEEEIAKKKSTDAEGKIFEHNEKSVNSKEQLSKTQQISMEEKKLTDKTDSTEPCKTVCADNKSSEGNGSKSVSTENKSKIDHQNTVTSVENKSDASNEENRESHKSDTVIQNAPESNTETIAEDQTPRKSKRIANITKSKAKSRTSGRNKANNRNKINSCGKSDIIKMKKDSVERMREKLIKKARQAVYRETSSSSPDLNIPDVKKHKRHRKPANVYRMIYSDESSVDVPDNKKSTPHKKNITKKRKSNIFDSSDGSDAESANTRREHRCTSEIQSIGTSTPKKVDRQEQNIINNINQLACPKLVGEEDNLNVHQSLSTKQIHERNKLNVDQSSSVKQVGEGDELNVNKSVSPKQTCEEDGLNVDRSTSPTHIGGKDKLDVNPSGSPKQTGEEDELNVDQSVCPKHVGEKDNLNVDKLISPKHMGNGNELNSQNTTLCKEKSVGDEIKADGKLLEQHKVTLTPLNEAFSKQLETSKDKEETVNNSSGELRLSFKTIPHVPDTIKALAESSQSPKKSIRTVEVEQPPDVPNTETDLEKHNENSSDFPPLLLSPEPEDDDDSHSDVALNIVEEDAVLSPAKKPSVLENDLELSSTVPEKRNFPINFVSEIKEYHLTEITFNETSNDKTANKKSHSSHVISNERYEEVYFDESKYVPKPKRVFNIDNFQINIVVDEDENGAQRYCKLSVQPLQNLFEMRPIKITDASLGSSNLNEKKSLSSDSVISMKKLDGSVSKKQLEKSVYSSGTEKVSKDLIDCERSPSTTESEYSISRSRMSELHRNQHASSTKSMLVTRTVDGRKRIAPVRLDDYDYEGRQRRRCEDSERRRSSDRQRERNRDRDWGTERYRDRDRESDRRRDRESERYRDRDREFDRNRDNERYRDRDRGSERYRARDREQDWSKDRDCYKDNDKYRDEQRDFVRLRDSDRGRYREIERDTYKERSGDKARSRERDEDVDDDQNKEDNEITDKQAFARDRSRERRKNDGDQSDNRIKELIETKLPEAIESLRKRELIKYDDICSQKSSDVEEGQCIDDDDDDLMNQVIISKTLSPRKKRSENPDLSIVGNASKLPPKKRKASDDISLGPLKIPRTEEPQALLKKVDLEKFLTAVHGDDSSTSRHQHT